jgi:hypothetical protein
VYVLVAIIRYLKNIVMDLPVLETFNADLQLASTEYAIPVITLKFDNIVMERLVLLIVTVLLVVVSLEFALLATQL